MAQVRNKGMLVSGKNAEKIGAYPSRLETKNENESLGSDPSAKVSIWSRYSETHNCTYDEFFRPLLMRLVLASLSGP